MMRLSILAAGLLLLAAGCRTKIDSTPIRVAVQPDQAVQFYDVHIHTGEGILLTQGRLRPRTLNPSRVGHVDIVYLDGSGTVVSMQKVAPSAELFMRNSSRAPTFEAQLEDKVDQVEEVQLVHHDATLDACSLPDPEEDLH